MTTYRGSCHCGAIRFEIDTVIDRVTQCNCSVCTKKGILHHRVAPENFRLLGDDATLGTYKFGTRVAKHHFCTTCGIHTFTRPRAAPELYTVNVRCLDDYDLQAESPEIAAFDGRHWEQEAGKLA
ncbi:GFA family protein [Variovorax robiniae]|uniref:GFA family protein n=1 Tax=Variovorax robiniae TaxID=1836199 RepID=A0ABU8X4D5_9BURK